MGIFKKNCIYQVSLSVIFDQSIIFIFNPRVGLALGQGPICELRSASSLFKFRDAVEIHKCFITIIIIFYNYIL